MATPSEESRINLKVSLKLPGAKADPEVQRFWIEDSLGGNFDALQEKLSIVFSQLKDKIYTISWVDVDGDEIVVNSDESLKIALAEVKGPLLKLNVTVRGKTNKEPWDSSNDASSAKEKIQKALEESKEPEEESLEEIFNHLSAKGNDYLRQLGKMITDAVDSLDSLVAEEEDEEEDKKKEQKEKKEDALEKKKDDDGSDSDSEDDLSAKVKTSLEKLTEMGFTDEGGWLTQLLMAKGGDASKALAAIQPAAAKKHD